MKKRTQFILASVFAASFLALGAGYAHADHYIIGDDFNGDDRKSVEVNTCGAEFSPRIFSPKNREDRLYYQECSLDRDALKMTPKKDREDNFQWK